MAGSLDESAMRGLSDDSSAQERMQTLQYFEQLKSSPTGWRMCATHFSQSAGNDHVQFFCLQVVEHHVRLGHASSSDDDILSLRSVLISWMQWPLFFSDLLQCLQSGGQCPLDLYLRILTAIDEEVVDRHIIHTQEENTRNTAIKDTMRDQCVLDLVESWYQILVTYEEVNHDLACMSMDVVGAYVSWIDITLIANDRFVERFLRYLSVPSLRESAAECLREIISKGMEPHPKIKLVESLAEMLESMGVLSLNSHEEGDIDFQVKLSHLVCGMGSALVTSWNKLVKRGDMEDAQIVLSAIEAKLPYLQRYLSDEDDGVSEAMISFAVQYISVLKQCSNLSDNDRANLQTLLYTVINKFKYDEDYNFLSQISEDEKLLHAPLNVHCPHVCNTGEDEVTFLEYRKELKVLFENIAALDPSLVLQTTQSLLSTSLSHTQTDTHPFMNTEVALRMLYLVGEAITDKQFGACNVPNSPWHQMMTMVVQSEVRHHKHIAVLLQFYETIVRYDKFFTAESRYISGIMELFLSTQGLRHPNCMVRSRLCYLFTRFVKGVRNQLGGMAQDILKSLQELLLMLPFSPEHRDYLSGNDMMFLYEVAGVLIVASLQPPESKGLQMRGLLAPLVQRFTVYLHQLSRAQALTDQEQIAQCLNHILSFASRASKVFTNHQMVQQNGCLECFAEPLPVFLRGLEGVVQCSLLQAGVRQYLHRMIICLGDELLHYVPMAVSLLLKDCKSQEIQEFIPLLNQLVTKYKEKISPFLQNLFMPVVQTIIACLNYPFDPNDLEEQRDHQNLQKCYFLFLSSLATNNLTDVIAKGANNLEEVLGTLVQGAVEFPDPTVQKVCFGVLRRLVTTWAPNGAMPGFVDYTYKNILPICFLAPLRPTFDLNDGHSFIALGEIAGVLKAMLITRGAEAVSYLQNDYLPTLHMSPAVIEELIQKIQELETKPLRQYFKVLFQQLRAAPPSRFNA